MNIEAILIIIIFFIGLFTICYYTYKFTSKIFTDIFDKPSTQTFDR